MAWYVAHHHVGLDKFIARPGEVFEADFSTETEERLCRLGAVEKLNMDVQPEESAAAFGLAVLEEEAEEFAALSEREVYEEPEEETAEIEPEETEPEPMEIDVAEAVKPAKKGRKKNGN